ncbi:MAG: HD domain-containing protein [Planctomycetota bacterium]|nr:HD domain-containing protein [Planctomycetota bacterium]
MTRRFVSQLNVGENIDQIFLVRSVRELKTRADKRYLDVELSDRSGTIAAKIWDGVDKVLGAFQVDDYVKVRGQVTEYKGQLQITVSSISKAKDEGINEAEMLPHTEKDPAEMLGRLKEVLTTGVTEPNLRRLISLFLDDPGFMATFKRSSAATTFHHAYIGGLLEHTVSMLNMALRILPEYPALDKNLLLAAVFLHDIGKTVEMSGTRGFYFTDEGKMLGHVYMGAEMIETRARTLAGFPHQLLNLLKHMVLSHHGTLEWGSPVLPCTMEAIALHYLDNLDAKMNAFVIETNRIRDPERRWSDWSRMFERELYRGAVKE